MVNLTKGISFRIDLDSALLYHLNLSSFGSCAVERPQMSISNFTPNHIHQSKTKIQTEKLWKN